MGEHGEVRVRLVTGGDALKIGKSVTWTCERCGKQERYLTFKTVHARRVWELIQ